MLSTMLAITNRMVEKLTPEIIEETIKAFVEENRADWLKLYHFAGEIDTDVFTILQAEYTKSLKELDELIFKERFYLSAL